jgi:hypothetical protein
VIAAEGHDLATDATGPAREAAKGHAGVHAAGAATAASRSRRPAGPTILPSQIPRRTIATSEVVTEKKKNFSYDGLIYLLVVARGEFF